MELSAPDLILQNGYDTMDESDESMLIVDDEFADIESEPVVEKSSDHTTVFSRAHMVLVERTKMTPTESRFMSIICDP